LYAHVTPFAKSTAYSVLVEGFRTLFGMWKLLHLSKMGKILLLQRAIMKYIIDMIDDMRENIQNAEDYTLLAMLLKEDSSGNLQNVGEKRITSFYINDNTKELHLGFLEEDATTKTLLESVNSLDMSAMMYEVMVKISDKHPLMQVIGFGEDHDTKQYTFFVMA